MSRDMAGLVHYHARILAGKQVEDHIHSKAYTFITRQHLRPVIDHFLWELKHGTAAEAQWR